MKWIRFHAVVFGLVLLRCSSSSNGPGAVSDGGVATIDGAPTLPDDASSASGSADSGSTDSDGSNPVRPDDPGGPAFLSFGTNVARMTEGESVRFVAILTHPRGLGSLAGGHLTDSNGVSEYGAFVADQQGSYSLDLSWSQISQVNPIEFETSEEREFRAQFFDVDGKSATRTVRIRFDCANGKQACAGTCTNTFASRLHCGGCGRTCGTASGDGAYGECTGGSCEGFRACTPGPTTCRTFCASKGLVCSRDCRLFSSNSFYRTTFVKYQTESLCNAASGGVGGLDANNCDTTVDASWVRCCCSG